VIGIKYWTGMFKSGGAWGILSCGIGIKYWVVSSVGGICLAWHVLAGFIILIFGWGS